MIKIALQETLDTSQPIDIFFNIIDDGVQYAREESLTYMTEEVRKHLYHAVISSRICIDTCKDWCGKRSEETIWANFKTFSLV